MTVRRNNSRSSLFGPPTLPTFTVTLLLFLLLSALTGCGNQPVQETVETPGSGSGGPKKPKLQCGAATLCETMGQRCGSHRKGDDSDLYCYAGAKNYAMDCVYWNVQTNKGTNAANTPSEDKYITQGYCIAPCTTIDKECGIELWDEDASINSRRYVYEIFDNPGLGLICKKVDPTDPKSKGICQIKR